MLRYHVKVTPSVNTPLVVLPWDLKWNHQCECPSGEFNLVISIQAAIYTNSNIMHLLCRCPEVLRVTQAKNYFGWLAETGSKKTG